MTADDGSSDTALQRQRIEELEKELATTREQLRSATRNRLEGALLNQNVQSLKKEGIRLKQRVRYLRAQLDAEDSVLVRMPDRAAMPAEKTFAKALADGQATYSFRFSENYPDGDAASSQHTVSAIAAEAADDVSWQSATLEPGEIPGNDWTRFNNPGYTSEFMPTRSVSVIIPVYNGQQQLNNTLTLLSYQDYPKALTEIVIADDGSSPAAKVPAIDNLPPTKVVAQEDLGFRLAAARNLGAAAATGDILIFLDCDMLPDPQWISRHACWHHGTDIAVTPGSRRHINTEDVGDFLGKVKAHPGTPFTDTDWLSNTRAPRWIEEYYAMTRDLRDECTEIIYVVCGGNMGVSRELFEQVGGFSEAFSGWGGEDAELTYRLYSQGAVIVPNTDALCVHQGMDGVAGADGDESLEFAHQKVLLQDLIPVPPFRRHDSKTISTRPTLSVTVLASYEPAAQIIECVESILSTPLADLVIDVSVPDDHTERRSLEFRFGADPRVDCTGTAEFDDFIPYVAVVAPYVGLSPDTLTLMMESLNDNGYGMATAVDPGIGSTPAVVVYRQRAIQRALLTAGSQDDVAATIDRLFGVDSYDFPGAGVAQLFDAAVLPPFHSPRERKSRRSVHASIDASGPLATRLLTDLGLSTVRP